VKELRKMLGKDIVLCIAGNKIDLERNRYCPLPNFFYSKLWVWIGLLTAYRMYRTVQISDAEDYASTVGAKHHSTSAKKNQGVEEVFLDLTKRECSLAICIFLCDSSAFAL
tara:strand:+ start:859 stop:1191 length:333 start_codon:yes stop_codon:yes gene_type:complete